MLPKILNILNTVHTHTK